MSTISTKNMPKGEYECKESAKKRGGGRLQKFQVRLWMIQRGLPPMHKNKRKKGKKKKNIVHSTHRLRREQYYACASCHAVLYLIFPSTCRAHVYVRGTTALGNRSPLMVLWLCKGGTWDSGRETGPGGKPCMRLQHALCKE
jgi:hypothetical protein